MSAPINYHPHSRYTLHEKAELYPFLDLIWRKPDGPFIDLKVDYPDPTNNYADGTAYLRTEDIIEMAHVLGMATREEMDALKKENAELKAKLQQLPTMVESFKNELHRTTTDFLSALDATDSLAVAYAEADGSPKPLKLKKHYAALYPTEEVGSESDEGTKRDDSNSSESDESAAESGNESVSGERPDDVSSLVGDESDPLAAFLGLGDPSK